MVKKLFALFHREWNGLHEAAFLLSLFALLSQILALFRDRLLAHSFGAGQTLDIYYAAFRIPDFLFVGIASFMSAIVIIPILTKRAGESDIRAQKFLNDTFTVFFTLLIVISVALFFAIPFLSKIFFPGFTPAQTAELVAMTRLLLLSPILLGLSNLLGSVTQMLRKFFAFALAPLLYNIGIIFGALFLYPMLGPVGLALGVVLGAFLHFFVQFFVSYRHGFSLTVSWKPSFFDIGEVVRVSLPRSLGLMANQIALFALVAFAAIMEKGSITVFNLALNLQSVPVAIIGVSYATAAFPSLSKHFVEEEMMKFLNQVLSAAQHIIFWSLPVLVLMVVLRAQIVRTVLGSGLFDWTATMLTAACLALFAISIAAQSLSLLFVRAFYAAERNAVPFMVNLLSSVVIVFGGYFLLQAYEYSLFFRNFMESLFRVEGVLGTEVLMLALAYSVGMLLHTGFLMYLFRKNFNQGLGVIKQTLTQGLLASLIAGFVAYEFLQVLGIKDGALYRYLNLDTFWGIFTQGLIAGVAGLITWWLVLEIMNNSEIKEVRTAFARKFWKTRVVMPDKEEI